MNDTYDEYIFQGFSKLIRFIDFTYIGTLCHTVSQKTGPNILRSTSFAWMWLCIVWIGLEMMYEVKSKAPQCQHCKIALHYITCVDVLIFIENSSSISVNNRTLIFKNKIHYPFCPKQKMKSHFLISGLCFWLFKKWCHPPIASDKKENQHLLENLVN